MAHCFAYANLLTMAVLCSARRFAQPSTPTPQILITLRPRRSIANAIVLLNRERGPQRLWDIT